MTAARARSLAFSILLPFVGAACNASRDGAGEKAPGIEAGQATSAIVVRFADPGNAGVMAYLKREGTLERELAKANAKIEWVPAAGAFSANFEAMNTGTINASGAAISPIVGALSHNLKFKIFTIADPGEIKRSGVVSPAGSPIKTVRDLVGKRVAVNLAAHGDYVLLRALEKHGVPADQVVRVPIQPPEAAAAFATGKIDAWSTFGVFFTTAVRNGANVVVTETELDSDDVGVTSANVEQLRKNPQAFRVFLQVVQEATRLANQKPELFQNVFTDKGPTAVTGDNLRAAIEETRILPIPRVPTATDKKRVANVAEILFRNKSIDRKVEVEDLVFDIDHAIGERGKS